MIKKSKSTDSVGKQLEDQVAQAKTGFAEAGSKLTHAINGKDIQLGNKQKIVVKNKIDEENFDLSLDVGAESAADPIVLAQAEATVMADATTASSASSAAGTAGAEAGAGAAAGSGAAAGAAAGTAAMSVGTMAMIGVGVAAVAVAATGGAAAAVAAATPAAGFVLAGVVALGQVNNAGGDLVVEAFKADGTQLLTSSSVVNADGTFTINVTENYTGPVMIRLTDTNPATTNYVDEGTGGNKTVATDLRVMVNVSGNGTIPAMITPLTELAVRELVGDSGGAGGLSVTTLVNAATGLTATAADITATNDSIKTALGLTSDIVTTTPVTVDNGAGFAAATAAQQAYGKALAAISGMEASLGSTTGAVLNALAQGLSGTTLSQTAIDQLIVGATTVDTYAATANVATPGSFATGTAAALTAAIGSNISAIDISADTGNATDFITQTAAQTITATLDAALVGTKLWGSADGGTTWTDVSGFVAGTALTWNGVTLAGDSTIKFAITANTVAAFTGATADILAGTKVSVQSYGLDTTAPAFTSGTAVNFAENGTAAAYVSKATDGAGHLLSYTFGGADLALFDTDPNSGVVKFKVAPNFEVPSDAGANNIYDISVTATDGAGNSSTQAVAITVTNVNEAPTLTSGATASFAENGVGTVHTVVATDPDAATTLTYALAGTDAALFNINASTGAVTFAAAPNFEAPTDAGANNVYNVTVTASDGTNTTTAQAVAITVTNVNEAPTLTSGAAASFAENGTGTVYTATATDPDAGATLTYALAGADAALFNINASTGAVTFATSPNFEAPADAGANNVYDITVTASDGTNTTAAQAVAITVTNVNEAPALTSGATSTTTLAVNQAFSNDVSGLFSDVDAGNVFSYSATGLPTGITISSTTGIISGTPTVTGTAQVVVTATDSGGLTASHTVTVNVVTAPVISSIASAVAQAKSGDALTFTATISEAVTVTGTPTLTLDVGGTAMTATYTGGTGTATLTFTATTPATGDDATVAVTAINLNGGSVIGNTTTQPLVDTTTGQVVTAFVVDNSNPVFTSAATANAAENQTAAYTSATTDGTAVTYTLGGADAALFNINNSTGAVTFAAAPNFEVAADAGADNVYNINVTATDALSHAATQAVAITVTDVNEAPALTSGATSTTTLAVNQAFSNDASGLFSDVDAGNVFSYSATGLPTGITISSTTGIISGTPTATGTAQVVVTATDSGGLTASHTVTVNVVTAPTLTSTIDNVTNFDVTSNIVLTASLNVTAVAGKNITIVNDGGTGFHGEATVNTQDILVTDTTKVTITNNTITINPGFDLDLSNNYHITVDAGAFVNAGSVVSAAVSDSTTMNFSTVTPGAAAGGVAGAAASQKMVDGTDALVVSYGWWDIETLGSTVSGSVSGDLSAGNIAVVFKDYDPLPGDAFNGYTGIGSPGDDYVSLTGFGSGDLLYIDNQTNAAPNDLTQTAIIHSGVAPSQVQFDGYTPNGGQPIWVDITTTAGTTAFDSVAGLQSLLSLAYVPIVSA